MTEKAWCSAEDPNLMLEFLRARNADERRLRMFACQAMRRVMRLLSDVRSRDALIVAERYASGVASAEELRDARNAAAEALRVIRNQQPDEEVSDFYQPNEAAAEGALALTAENIWLHRAGQSQLEAVIAAAGHAANAAAAESLCSEARLFNADPANGGKDFADSGQDDSPWTSARRSEFRWQADLLRKMFAYDELRE